MAIRRRPIELPKGAWKWKAALLGLAFVALLTPVVAPGGLGLHDTDSKKVTWWKWLDLAGVPVTLAALGFWFQQQQRRRELEERAEAREDNAVTNFIKEMQPLLLKEGLRDSKPEDEVRGVARALLVATLSQLESKYAPSKRSLIIRFLFDSGLRSEAGKGNIFSLPSVNLSKANLRGAILFTADLGGANLFWANLRKANLWKVNLTGANLRGANLWKANLSGADLSWADLSWADLSWAYLDDVKWDEYTKWPEPEKFEGARNVPTDLKKQLGL